MTTPSETAARVNKGFDVGHCEFTPGSIRAAAKVAHAIQTLSRESLAKIIDRETHTPELLAALIEARDVIKIWHGDGAVWEAYQQSPEMRQINAAIARAKGTA